MHMLPGPRYRVYYMNNYKRSFHSRVVAMEWILTDCQINNHYFADYEILDGSDQ